MLEIIETLLKILCATTIFLFFTLLVTILLGCYTLYAKIKQNFKVISNIVMCYLVDLKKNAVNLVAKLLLITIAFIYIYMIIVFILITRLS